MPRRCLFCENTADSREHLWPAWIHDRIKIEESIRIAIGKLPVQKSDNAEIKIKCVCKTCNSGWMSQLENQCLPLVGSLAQDLSISLDSSQQSLLATWALKMAMVTDSTNKKTRDLFYEKEERDRMRSDQAIPERAKVWIGRASKNSFAAIGTDVWIDMPNIRKVAKGSVSTIVVGRLVIQVLTIHVLHDHLTSDAAIAAVQPKPGRWNDSLLSVWPVGSSSISWPPKLTFDTATGGPVSIASLVDRWRIGKNVS